ncbi:MAG: OmpA family protein [Candidatus Dasytiphilus stammeri]
MAFFSKKTIVVVNCLNKRGIIGMLPNRHKKSCNPILAQEIIKNRKNLLWWLIPLLILIFMILWYFHHSDENEYNNHIPTSSSHTSTFTTNTTYSNSVLLPNGTSINIRDDSIEMKLLTFIKNPWKIYSDNMWFDLDQIFFDSGEKNPQINAKMQLNNVAAILKAYPNVKLKIGGYTDNIGSIEQNQILSQARAEEIKKELIQLNIPSERLFTEGYGETHPVASNDTAEGRAKNRRVSIRIIEKQINS